MKYRNDIYDIDVKGKLPPNFGVVYFDGFENAGKIKMTDKVIKDFSFAVSRNLVNDFKNIKTK